MKNMILIWAGRVSALLMVLLVFAGIIQAGSLLSWLLLVVAVCLILLGGGFRKR